MTMPTGPVFIGFALVMMALLFLQLRTFRAFDQLIQHLYDHERERWVDLGRPLGYFWRPADEAIPLLAGLSARKSCLRAWLRAAPAWMPPDSEAARLLRFIRLSTLIWWVGLFFMAGVLFAAGQT